VPVLSAVDPQATADVLEQLRRIDQPPGGSGVYLTDEVFLYRLVELVAVQQDDVVELEDCYLLDVVHVLVSDLRARGLRVVTPVPRSQRPCGNP
jgi:hypothetical protein